ncbi:YmfQ family protein [Agarivorans sp. B2Z047]|uniref:YmfQ family protein n=3 Tax=Agarivorans sp. B2Z047 TaxID=2652721 RepID=UPI002018B849|nr:putative phage tail protein [Agarivorans sp. B2Z047]UQN43750.1 DUF2313 domain-containing protein [Agarivorans sp. B2Z047]
MGMSATDYRQMAQKLLPPGFAWSRNEADNITYFLQGLAESLARADSDISDIEKEIYPESALILIDEWEDALGLPECGLGGDDLAKRRLDAYAKDTAYGGLSQWYYVELATRAGFEVEIDEAYGHHCQSHCEAPLYHPKSGLAPVVYSAAPVERWATCNDSCLTPVRLFGDGRLECLLNTYKPAEGRFVFAYTEV